MPRTVCLVLPDHLADLLEEAPWLAERALEVYLALSTPRSPSPNPRKLLEGVGGL